MGALGRAVGKGRGARGGGGWGAGRGRGMGCRLREDNGGRVSTRGEAIRGGGGGKRDGSPPARGQEGGAHASPAFAGAGFRREGWVAYSRLRGLGAVDTPLEAGIYSFCQLSPSRRPGIGPRVGGKQPTIPYPGVPHPSLYMKVLLFSHSCYLSPVRVPLPNGGGSFHPHPNLPPSREKRTEGWA